MKTVLFLFMIFFVVSCTPKNSKNDSPPSNKQSLVNEVRNKAFVQLIKEKELYPFGTASEMMDQIKMLGLALHYYKEVDIGEARELLIYAETVFLNIINDNEKIRPYLNNYPFKPENIQIKIFLQNPDGSECSPEKLCILSMIDGVLKYKIDQPDKYRLLTIHKETYDEAVSKLNTIVSLVPSELK